MASFAALLFERFGSRVFRHWGGARVGRDPCVRAWHLIGFLVPAPPPQACSVRKHGEHLCKYFGTSDELMDEAARRERGGGRRRRRPAGRFTLRLLQFPAVPSRVNECAAFTFCFGLLVARRTFQRPVFGTGLAWNGVSLESGGNATGGGRGRRGQTSWNPT